MAAEIGKASPVRIVIVEAAAEASALGEALEAAGVEVAIHADDGPTPEGRGEIAEIARLLREFERVLGDSSADAVLVASDSPAALAAVLVATKLGIPVGRLEGPDGPTDDGANARLIRQLADTGLAPAPAAIVEWARDGYPARR
jgi:UDP-N-acetylglucosamine 2-epimerase